MTEKRELLWSRRKNDFRVDTFRAGGPGGQNQNKRDSAVRITDIQTGLSAESREHRTQPMNKKAAFNKLVQKLIEHYDTKEKKERFPSGDKVIRTYHEPDDRVTDHDTGKRYSYRQTISKGEMDEMIDDRARQLLNGGSKSEA